MKNLFKCKLADSYTIKRRFRCMGEIVFVILCIVTGVCALIIPLVSLIEPKEPVPIGLAYFGWGCLVLWVYACIRALFCK